MTCHKLSYQTGLMLVCGALYVPRFVGGEKEIVNVTFAPASSIIFWPAWIASTSFGACFGVK